MGNSINRQRIDGLTAARYPHDADRLTALHTPDQPDGVWTIYGYDACGRKVVEMESGDGDTEVENWAATCHTATLDAASPQEWDTGGYSFKPDCPLHPKATTAWYYDDYSFLTLRGLGSEFRFSAEITLNPAEAASVQTGGVEIQPRRIEQPSGMLTGIYGVPGYEVYYYDGEGRQIERYATGYNTGRTTTTYTPDGRPLTVSTVYPSGSPYDDFTVRYTYDACGRVTSRKISKASRPVRGTFGGVQATAMTADGGLTAEQLSDTARVAVSYDRAGRVARTSLGANASITAAYDVHGWVNARRFDYSGGTFTETMLYADGATPRFNGFISSRIWDGNRYDYTYDAMGRLVGARYSGTPGRNFTCAYEYDPRGNIQRLMRKGITGRLPSGVETFGDLDIITVTHSGNRPVGFTNEGDNPATFEGRTGAGIHEQAELSYDDAGRVTADTSRGIRRIDYNHRGQPVTIIFDDGHKHTMTYDGRGNLLKTIFYEAVGQVVAGKPTRYRVTAVRGYSGDGQVTEGDSLVMMRFAGGYFDGRGRACYYMPDYQGNNLGVVDADGHLTQRTDYYPYGEAWRQPEADVNPWLYSDKELLSVDGQHEYDYGARRYTPGFPMFTTPDPLSEVRPWHSPYLFCGANPVMNTDPTGMYFVIVSKDYALIEGYRKNIEDRLKMFPGSPNLSDEGLSDTERVLGDMLKELTVLEFSETQYNVELSWTMITEDGTIGATTYEVAHNRVNIRLADESMALFSHEMKHAYQFEMGEISFGIPKSNNGQNANSDDEELYPAGAPYYDQTDEIEAYNRGLMFGGERWENVKDSKFYRKLNATPLGWHSSMFGTTEDRVLQHNSNKFRGCFKANGKIFLPQEE